jgi:hypothetical protein
MMEKERKEKEIIKKQKILIKYRILVKFYIRMALELICTLNL